MSLSKEEQFLELVKPAKHPLILIPPYPTHDALATSFAIGLFMEELGKSPTVGCDHFSEKKEELSFLQVPKNFETAISGARDFVLSFNTEHNAILNVRTERFDKELRIHLTPEHGTIDPRDFSFILAKYKFDLVITISARDKESLGKMYENNPDIFYEVPIVNIDFQSANEQYGQLNLVEVTASSSSEIAASLLEKVGKELLTGPVAEALLTGIISATESFQKKNTTPRALEIASRLMEKGADQQKIVKNLYKTQPLNLLKLWGRIMGNVHYEEAEKLIWAPVTIEDLIQSRTKMEDLHLALDKLRGSFTGASVFVLLFKENQESLHLFLKTTTQDELEKIQALFPEGQLLGDTLEGTLSGMDLASAERLIQSWITKEKK
ncbi:MAG: hypothetical protein ABI747_00490 [Candidatus Moraniibacteriota bacterium]